MRLKRTWITGLVLGLILSAHASFAQDVKPLQILFIGNSYTYGNDLPKMISELARAGKQRMILTEKETPGGWSFKKHFEGGKAFQKIQAKKWDYVVLQNHSLGALDAREEMFTFGKKLHEAIAKQDAKTLLFMTWARQNKPETQEQIAEAYQKLAKDLNIEVAPVGLAWQAALKADPKLVLHTEDKSHPNKAGTYLAACVFYAKIFGKSPEGLPGTVAGLKEEQARQLQAIAWQAVSADSKKQ